MGGAKNIPVVRHRIREGQGRRNLIFHRIQFEIQKEFHFLPLGLAFAISLV